MNPASNIDGGEARRDVGAALRVEDLPSRIGAAAAIPQVLRDLGQDPEAICGEAQVDIGRLADPEGLLPIADVIRLVSLSLKACRRADLGLLIAAHAGAEKAGVLGDLFASADDLRAALHDLVRYFHINSRSGVAVLTVDDGVAQIQLALTASYGDVGAVFEDASIGVLFHAMRGFLGSEWRPTEVLLSHTPASGGTAYRKFFGAPVQFNALCMAIIFPADDLDRHSIVRERERRRLEAAATKASTRLGIGFDEEVRWTIRAHLGERNLTIEPIADDLGTSPRTLNRRLAERGVTFAKLLQAVRFATARQLLVESDTPLSVIATAVGYAEPNIFSTAFRAWAGATPSEWRRLHGRGYDTLPGSD